jgi:hypothetical protein
MKRFLPSWLHDAATPPPPQALFEHLVQDHHGHSLSGLSVVALSGTVFSLGEKLAWCRKNHTLPTMETLAELKALYVYFADDRQMTYFSPHRTWSLPEIEALFAPPDDTDEQANDNTPADVTLMIELYNAVWSLHFEAFAQDPAGTLAEWNASDRFQTRAMRAVLCDIDYGTLVHLALLALLADASAAEKRVRGSVLKKQNILLEILATRGETPPDLVKILHGQSEDIMKVLTVWARNLGDVAFPTPRQTLFRGRSA